MNTTSKTQRILTVLTFVALSFVLALSAQAATYTVCASGCDYSSVQGAVNAASDGDTLDLSAETFSEGDILLDIDLTIKASGGQATIDGDGDDTVIEIDEDAFVVLENLKLTDADQAIVTNYGTAYLKTVYVNGTGTNSTYGGIVNYSDGFLWLRDNSVVSNNRSLSVGGGITNFGDLEVDNTTITGNRGRLGGGIFNSQGDVSVSTSSISGNHATNRGGGYANVNVGGGAVVILPSATFSTNTADVDCDKYYDIHRTPACVN